MKKAALCLGVWMALVPALAVAQDYEMYETQSELSYRPDTNPRSKMRVRVQDIQRFEGYRFRQLRAKLKEVMEAKKYPDPLLVFRSATWSGTGRDAAIIRTFDKWATLDREGTMRADYEEVHGAGSWRQFLMEVEEVIAHGEDELLELVPELSAPPRAASDR